MPIYKCGNCDNEIEFGTKYCPECGTKISWPKEKKAKAKPIRKRKKVNLPINPDNLYKVVSRNGFFSKPYDILILFFSAAGIILSLVMSNRQKKILRWIDSLQTEEIDLDIFRKNVASIRRCGIWAIVLGIITVLINIGLLADPKLRLSGYQITDQAITTSILISLGYIICASIGIATGAYVCKRTTILLNELEGDEEYTYEFNEEPEPDDEESDDDLTEDDDEFDDGL